MGKARQQGCFGNILEQGQFYPRDPPWLSNIYEARLTNDFVSLFKDVIKISKFRIHQNTVNKDVIIKVQNWQFVLDNKAGLTDDRWQVTGDNLYCLIGVKSDDIGNYYWILSIKIDINVHVIKVCTTITNKQ